MENKDSLHFVKIVEYSNQPWRTDIIFGQKGSKAHGHLALSGAIPIYMRSEEGKEIIKDF